MTTAYEAMKCGLGKFLQYVSDKSCSHQNLFKFDTWIHCIMPINMCIITC